MALLSPLLSNDPMARLRGSGDLIEARSDLGALPDPLPLPIEADSPSVVMAQLRRAER